MSIRHTITITIATVAACTFGSAPKSRADDIGDNARHVVTAAEQTASLARQAPIGHRQPRAADVLGASSSALELEQRRQDEQLDRRLIICRGC
jgi:hypothetical protein